MVETLEELGAEVRSLKAEVAALREREAARSKRIVSIAQSMEIACGGVVELNARLRNAISDIEYLKLRDVSNTRYCNNIFDEIALTLDALTDKVLPMSAKPISDLRRRMLEDMAVRKFGEKTRHDYIRHVETFASFLGRSPDTATAEDVRRYQVHLTESGVQPPTRNSSASALRFFFGTTLDRAKLARHLARVHYPRKLPRVLSPEEVGRLLEAAPGPVLKYKAALSIAYGAGLRAGEVIRNPSHLPT